MTPFRFLVLHPPRPISIVGLALFGLLVWFGGPVVGLDHPLARTALILLVPFTALLVEHSVWRRSQTRRQRFVDSLLKDREPNGVDRRSEGRKLLSREAAFEYLSLTGHPTLATEKPWFWVLGGKACGKSSVIRNASLALNPYAGTGVTREYSWWTSATGANLLEIPIAQVCELGQADDTDNQGEQAGLLRDIVAGSDWRRFLDAVAAGRPEQPVNGLVLVISLAKLQQADRRTMAKRSAILRARVADVERRLAAQVPCYLVFSKADSIAGFTEFFATLTPDERQQVWGLTFPAPKRGRGPLSNPSADRVRSALAELADALRHRRLRRVSAERDPVRRAAIFAFPTRFAALTEKLAELVRQLTADNGSDQPPTVRGLYFCSTKPHSGKQANGGFFVPAVFKRIVLREAGLARSRRPAARLRRRLSNGFYPLLTAALVSAGAALALDYYLLDRHSRAIIAQLQGFQTAIEQPADAAARIDERRLGEALEQLRVTAEKAAKPPFPVGRLGLYPVDSVRSAARRAYHRALTRYLLPFIQQTVERQLAASWMAPTAARELLDLYRTLAERNSRTAARVNAWLTHNLATPGRADRTRHPLAAHVDTLFGGALYGAGPATVELDQGLIDRVEQRLGERAPAAAPLGQSNRPDEQRP